MMLERIMYYVGGRKVTVAEWTEVGAVVIPVDSLKKHCPEFVLFKDLDTINFG